MAYEKALCRYEEHLKISSYSQGTIRQYLKDIGLFLDWCLKEKGITRIQEVTKELLRQYQNLIYAQRRLKDGKPLSLNSKYHRLINLKNFFKILVRGGIILYSPAQDLEMPRPRKDILRDTLKENEVRKILEAAKPKDPLTIRDRAILELFYSTGMRNTELRTLKISDIDLKLEEIRIRQGKGRFGHRQRLIPLGRMAAAHLEEYLLKARPKLVGKDSPDILFVTQTGRQLHTNHVNLIVKKYAGLCGIKRRVYPHLFRHSFATHLLRRGADIRAIQEMLGHTCLDSTKVYTKVEITDLKRIHRKTHPRELA